MGKVAWGPSVNSIGGEVFKYDSVRSLFSSREWNDMVRQLNLSPQQARIIELILSGKRDKQIAAAMGLRVSTIRTYLGRMFERTGAGDRVELLLNVLFSLHRASTNGDVHKTADSGNIDL